MREPRFWSGNIDPKSREAAPLLRALLTPLAWLYAEITARKIRSASPRKVEATVICIGNLTAGGVGKSPVVAALRRHIADKYGLRVATLSRGYGGKLKGPLQVDPSQHQASDVGDEPLMLSRGGESWIGANRAAAGIAMSAAGVEVILMDDGHQNPGLSKDLSLIVVDAQTGFGNGYVIPKGPLREPVAEGLRRADAVILVGDGGRPVELTDSACVVMKGVIAPTTQPPPQPYVAFAGIGRPEKFFDTLERLDLDVRDAVPFPDHHAFSDSDRRYLQRLADDHGATLITTEKDFERLPEAWRVGVQTLPIEVRFKPVELLEELLSGTLSASDHER
ncbi:MAG: tetraacyldisaccharide 4'-kinase [Pseudomonadota bacterium]